MPEARNDDTWHVPNRPAVNAKSAKRRLPASLRVDALEGLRGYLALWALVAHVFWYSGLGFGGQIGALSDFAHGDVPVKIFMIVSGFVIFLNLDTDPVS